jgi:phytanoyl-CoA hydroxylase
MATPTFKHLTTEQVDAFWINGYLILEDFLDSRDITTLRASITVLTDWIKTTKHPSFQLEPESTDSEHTVVRKISSIHTHGGTPWDELMQRDDVLDLMEDLVGLPVQFHHSKVMMKAPHEGSKKEWHQDLPQGFVTQTEADRLRQLGSNVKPEQVPVVAIQYYLDDATLENGCLQLVPESHRQGLFEDPLDKSRIDPNKVFLRKSAPTAPYFSIA